MAGELKPTAVSARVQVTRAARNGSTFLLDVSIEAPPGITILFGPSGAGKSTLLDCIAGLLRPDFGKIAIGAEILLDSERGLNLSVQHRRVAYVFQMLALFPHMSVEENVAYGLAGLPKSVRLERVGKILEAFHIADLRDRRPTEISGGERQRAALARSLVTLPRVLLLDEPLTGLDAGLKSAILDDLRAWNAAQKIPILYVTHNRDEVDALGERVIALDQGRVVSEGAPREVLEAPRQRRLAQTAGFENFISGSVLELRKADGVMRVRLGDSKREIEVPLGHASPGDQVRVAIRAGDILLAAEHPTALSARNVLEGAIASIEHRGAMVIARVDCGVELTAHITLGAERALQLAAGKRVWAVLKTHSCHLVE